MEIIKTKLNDCLILKPLIFSDNRGFFMETFSQFKYEKILNIKDKFVQDNFSSSKNKVLRGLHLQRKNPQGKLVQVLHGEVFDVAVDLRANSETFGRWEGVILSSDNKKQFWIPPGFAHGFVVISDQAYFHYKCTDYYAPDDESCILWNDPSISIDWPINNPIVSEKDQGGITLEEFMK